MAKQNSVSLVERVQLLVDANKHGACEALVDASIMRRLAGKQAVSVKSLVADTKADILKHHGIVIRDTKAVADIAYATGIGARPGKAYRADAATIKADKLVGYKPRSPRSQAAMDALALIAGSKPSKPTTTRTRKPKPSKPTTTDSTTTDNG